MEDIIAKIQGMELSKTDSLIAEHILDSIDTIGLKTSTSLAEEISFSYKMILKNETQFLIYTFKRTAPRSIRRSFPG